MTASQMRIAETIDAFYGDAGARDGVSRSYKQAVEDLDAETIKALDGPYRYERQYLHTDKHWHVKAQLYSNQFQDSVHISRTSTSASRNEITNFSTMIQCDLRLRDL